ncbi:MAG: four helix bundle protein, partial [Crocinitomicaceae bacterium]|nr:four helix bundle protein [Crocinitomicaceae bacterium]
ISKMSIALKEANKTEYWISLLYQTDYLEKKAFDSLSQDITEILKLLTSIINSTKKNNKN